MAGLSWVAIMAGGLGAVYAALTLGQPEDLSLNGVTVAAGTSVGAVRSPQPAAAREQSAITNLNLMLRPTLDLRAW